MTLIHILRGPPNPDRETEAAELEGYTRLERAFLDRRCCALCGMPLSQPGCGAMLGESCDYPARRDRRQACLRTYKPRKRRKCAEATAKAADGQENFGLMMTWRDDDVVSHKPAWEGMREK